MTLSGDWAEVVDHLNSATKGPTMKREPVLIIAAIKAVILCAVAFGLKLTADQIIALGVAIEAVAAVFTRSKVSPAGGAS